MIFQRVFEPAEFLKLIQTEHISWFGSIKDGWLYSGDIAKKDEDGFLYILDREKTNNISVYGLSQPE